jgi:hypothetical protein
MKFNKIPSPPKVHGPEFMEIPLLHIELPVPRHRLLTIAEFIQARALAVRIHAEKALGMEAEQMEVGRW